MAVILTTGNIHDHEKTVTICILIHFYNYSAFDYSL